MKRERKEKHFIKSPQYPGGDKALALFIGSNLKYPEEAWKHKIEGVVRIRIEIDNRGEVVQTHIADHLGHGCDEEAERLVKLLKFQVPNNRKGRMTFNKTLNIRFRLPKAVDQKVNLKYSYTPAQKEAQKTEKPKPSNTGYTITFQKK